MELQRLIRSFEVRAAIDEADPNAMIVEGTAIVFGQRTLMYEIDGVSYYEVIERGALDGADMTDVPFKYNHSDHVMIMARTRNKTLELIPDENGLSIRARLADTTAGRDLYTLIKRGDIDKMSFAFTSNDESYDRATHTRSLKKFKKIWDVSGVDMPAYDQTHISARSYFEAEAAKEIKAMEIAEQRKRLLLLTY